MQLSNVFMLFGGLALFLYGMHMMSTGLEVAAGNRLKGILEKLTSNRLLGVLVGALITAAVQSSSATTVMTVGFVNSGLMTLNQAVGVIMGANIGTTITGQLIALDVGVIAPMIAFIGVALITFLKGKKVQCAGQIIAGLGILFLGMDLMGTAMEPLRESQAFIQLMTQFKNPLLGILAGALFTAVIQSSSASIGILQTLAAGGLIGIDSAVFVLFGQNIGTCITALIASVGTNRNAKRTTIIHLLFNVIGTVVFVGVCMLLPFTDWIAALTPNNTPAQLANIHTIFNVVTTLLLFPFGNLLAKLAQKILPVKASEKSEDQEMHLAFANEHNVGSTAIVIDSLRHEEERMLHIARDNVAQSFETLLNGTDTDLDKVNRNEEYLDYLNTEITRYISQQSSFAMSDADSATISALFDISGNIERIGDHATNMAEYVRMFQEKHMQLSERAQNELRELADITLRALNRISILEEGDRTGMLQEVHDLEAKTDELKIKFRNNQIEALKEGSCTTEVCVIYTEMLTDIERMLDHTLNIAQALGGETPEFTA